MQKTYHPRRPKPTKMMTSEQHAAYEERREAIRKVSKPIASMTDEERWALAQKVGTILTCEQRALSTYNCCLLAMQRPDATLVGGFQQWRRVGRSVKKGEHGAYIWIPLWKERDAGSGEQEGSVPDERRFTMVAVFDVSQTEESPTSKEAHE